MRRLRLPDDELLLREAYRWDVDRPRWWKEMDLVFNSGTEDDFIERARNPASAYIGIFDKEELIAVIILETPVPTVHEAHLLARRGVDSTRIGAASVVLISNLFSLGMTQTFVWVAERHTALKQFCVTIGLQPDGLVMWRGSYHRKPIKWVRYSIAREEVFGMTQAP